jgi:hypothetical protein
MAIPQTEKRFDAAAYLAWEEAQAERHEYVAGEVFRHGRRAPVAQCRHAEPLHALRQNSKALRVAFSSKRSRPASKPPIASSIPTYWSPATRATA